MASKILPYEECPSCKQKGNLELTLYRSYIHVYGIPVLNEGKQTEVECLSCECCIKPAYKPFFLKKSKYSEKIADEIREIKKYNKQSLWQLAWTSLLTIIFLIFLTVELIKNNAIKYLVSTDKENIALMENPQVGDIYKVTMFTEQGGNRLSLLKLIRIAQDTMVLIESKQHAAVGTVLSDQDWKNVSNKDGEVLWYVGKADKLYRRLTDHLRSGKLENNMLDSIGLIVNPKASTSADHFKLEADLIKEFGGKINLANKRESPGVKKLTKSTGGCTL
ncbi:GIY-YIG nuclease family protein [Flavobacterium cupreum]|nr:GIY-YIG nuclease family protein [Flavobacterium cupreum]